MPTLEKPKYRQIFGSTIKPVVSDEKDRLLAVASMKDLVNFIPQIDTVKNVDLLPIAFDACVVNRANKNGDIMDTNTGLSMYKTFVNKFIDTEHNRQKIIGVILTASLSEFGTNKPLSEQDVIGTKIPFNITLGGVLWRAVNGELCDLVEEAGDPTSSKYMDVSASWELGFTGYQIVCMEQGSKNFEDGYIVTDAKEIKSIKPYLKCFKGCGVKGGKSYYRMPCQEVVGMGCGLTEKPAADVEGVAVELSSELDFEDKEEVSAEEIIPVIEVETENVIEYEALETVANAENTTLNKENFSQPKENTVKRERESIMKITSIEQITDETLKQCTASVITEFLSGEIKKASDVYVQEKTQQATANEKLTVATQQMSEQLAEMKASLENLTKEKDARAKIDAFNSRMGEVYASYEFPDEVAKIVVEDIKSLPSDEAFASWKTKAETIFKPYSKTALASVAKAKEEAEVAKEEEAKAKFVPFKKGEEKDEEKKEEGKEEKKEDAKASEAVASVVEDVIDNAKQEDAGLPNSSSASSPGLKERFATAFASENFVIRK